VVDVLDKVMEFPQMGSGPNRQQIIDALRNTAQSASNNIAETASMPVDALAWALRKVGLPVGDKPLMGSDWMREKGLTAPVQEGASKVVGDTIGMISPMGLSKQGAQAIMEVGSKMKNLPVGMSIKDVSGAQGMLPSPSSLTMPSVPTRENMQSFSRVESVPLANAVSFQSARKWDKFNKGEHPGELIQGYGDKPVALRLENGEYVIYDGNHRTDLALKAGQKDLPMNVIDVKSYDPAHAGRKPVASKMSDDDLLAELLK
jgi:hypothetical protein